MILKNPVHPSEILKAEFLEPLSITAEALAEKLSVTTDEVDALLECRISLTAEMAVGLHKIFGMSSEFWIKLQDNYDLYRVRSDEA